MMRLRLSLVVTCLAAGCAGLKLEVVKSAQSRPSNLALFFTVQTRAGEPVPQLSSEQFRIFEDGALVSIHESRQTILNPEVAAEHYTLLLVDMSGSVTGSEQLPLLVEAAARFTDAVGKYQKVAVYAFDGGPDIYPIAAFRGSPAAPARAVASLATFRTRDPSTNLNGAVVRASGVLAQAVARARTPLRFGTLVVFTDGTDRAGRLSSAELEKALAEQDQAVFAIGVGHEIDKATLARIGRQGHWLVKDSAAMQQAFQTVADRIIGHTRSHYLLSYCSPARAGKHQVTVETVMPDTGKRGRLSYEFDATGFGPGCDPASAPPFALPTQRSRSAPEIAVRRPAPARQLPQAPAAQGSAAAGDPEGGDH
jgi:hypothetical protein